LAEAFATAILDSRTDVATTAPARSLDPAKTAVGMPERMVKLNRATGERFANIAASPVPVLLPFDTAAFLRDRTAVPETGAASANAPADNYLLGFVAAAAAQDMKSPRIVMLRFAIASLALAPFLRAGDDDGVVACRSGIEERHRIGWASPMRSTCCMNWVSRGA
jgi:hypothetical protein